jgi:hypothetical protein
MFGLGNGVLVQSEYCTVLRVVHKIRFQRSSCPDGGVIKATHIILKDIYAFGNEKPRNPKDYKC